MRILDYHEEESNQSLYNILEEKKFETWKIRDHCNLELLAVVVVMETLQMWLTFENSTLSKDLNDAKWNVGFGSFKVENRKYALCYQNIACYYCRLPKGEEHYLQQFWCEYSMLMVKRSFYHGLLSFP